MKNTLNKTPQPRQFTVFDYQERENRRVCRRTVLFCILAAAAVLFTAYNIHEYNRSFDNCERLLAEIEANTAILDQEIKSLNAAFYGLEADYE